MMMGQRFFLDGREVQVPPGMDPQEFLASLRKTYTLSSRATGGALTLPQVSSRPQGQGAIAPEPPSKWGSFGRGSLQGATFGFSDEMSGDKVGARRENMAAEHENPVSYTAGNIVGGIGSGVGAAAALGVGAAGAAGMGFRALLPRLAALGATEGAAAGVGYGDAETLGEGAKDAAVGAGVGGTLGTVLPSGVHGLRRLRNAGRVQPWANRYLKDAFEDSGEAGTEAAVANRLKDNPNLILADLTHDAQSTLDRVAGDPGPTLTRAFDALAKRQKGQSARLQPKMQAGLGKSSISEATDVLQGPRKAKVTEQYNKAYTQDIPLGPELQKLLKDKKYSSAFKASFDLIRKADDPVMHASFQRFKDTLKTNAASLSEKQQEEFAKALKSGNLLRMMKLTGTTDIPTPVLDGMQRTMQKNIDSLYVAGKGQEASIYKSKQDDLIEFLTDSNEEFGAARKLHREVKMDEAALRYGFGGGEVKPGSKKVGSALRDSTPTFRAKFAKMNPSEQKHTRVGILENLMQSLDTIEETGDALRVLTKKHSRDLLETAFGSKQAYKEFEKTLRDEVAMSTTHNVVRQHRTIDAVGQGLNNAPLTGFLVKQAIARLLARAPVIKHHFQNVNTKVGDSLLGRKPPSNTGIPGSSFLRYLTAPAALGDIQPQPEFSRR